jgi:uncharacterized protein YegL
MENVNFYDGEMPTNYEQKCPVMFVIDRSGSMSGSPIAELNKGLREFEIEIKNDPVALSRLDVAIVSFGSDTKVVRDFALIDDAPMPSIAISGSTALVDGTREGLRLLKDRKDWYKSTQQTFYRPYVILITDGGPDGGQDVDGLATEIRQLANAKSLCFWPIGVTGADMNMLTKISVADIPGNLPPLKLDGLKFVELFKWLSSSFTKISNSKDGQGIDVTPESGSKNPFQFNV